MVELYEFTLAGPVYYRYTSASSDVYFAFKNYTATPISRSSLANSEEPLADQVTITVPRGNPVSQLFIQMAPSYLVNVRISLLEDSTELVSFIGYLGKVTYSAHEATFACTVMPSFDGRNLLPRKYQAQCAHALYSTGCGVDKSAYAKTGYITSITGITVISSVFATEADGVYVGGMILCNNQYRTIRSHVGNTVSILGTFSGVSAGNVITVYPGCPHTIAVCDSRFSNSSNYGGQNLIPGRNPFTQSIGY